MPTEEKRQLDNRETVRVAVRAALVEQLKQRPFRDITIGQLARDAGLSRTAFYFYFHDKNDVFRAISEDVAAELYQELERWWGGTGSPQQLVRKAAGGLTRIFERNSEIVRAAVELSTYDSDFADFYSALIQQFIDKTIEQLELELAMKRVRQLDPSRTAVSLAWAAERVAFRMVCIEGRPASEAADAITFIWIHTLYPGAVLE